MSKTEMHRRLSEMPEALRLRVFRMVMDGYGTTGIVQNSPATIKQANAVAEWVTRYGQHRAHHGLTIEEG